MLVTLLNNLKVSIRPILAKHAVIPATDAFVWGVIDGGRMHRKKAVWAARTWRQHAPWIPCLRALLRLLLYTSLPAPQVQERQNRVCTTVAIAIVAETCAPFTVLPALMNEYKVRACNAGPRGTGVVSLGPALAVLPPLVHESEVACVCVALRLLVVGCAWLRPCRAGRARALPARHWAHAPRHIAQMLSVLVRLHVLARCRS